MNRLGQGLKFRGQAGMELQFVENLAIYPAREFAKEFLSKYK